MSTCITVDGLKKSYAGRTVVDHLSFTVQKGEVFGLLGHNGAGKSTTIELLLGLRKPEQGRTTILGMEPETDRKKLFERVGVQFQSSNYQSNIRVDEACQERALLYAHPADYRELLKQFGIGHLEKSPVSKLSGGEKQKLSVVLALVGKPEIVFLDELTTGLDVAARHEVWRTLKGLKEKGLTIFLTTHYMEEAENLCDHLCLMKNGRKVAEGTVQEIVAKSPYDNLENAYLWYMDEEVAL